MLYCAEEQYLVDKYKQNKDAFATVKTELLYLLEQKNADELNLEVSYDSEGKRKIHIKNYMEHLTTSNH